MTSKNLFSTQDTKQGSCTYELKELAKNILKQNKVRMEFLMISVWIIRF